MPSRPSLAELRRAADQLSLHLDDATLRDFGDRIAATLGGLKRLDELPDEIPPVRYPRTPGHRPGREENQYNAWYWRSEVKGAESGLLAGRTVALKDNICLAGVPLMNGSPLLEGYVPEFDATIVTRMLDAGATIAGKAVCEHLCLAATSTTAATGPVLNPRSPAHSAGGSSSGSGALVAAGEVDIAIGCDQGGSIRIPASHCGVYGLKPTYGLVPYTGIFALEQTIDHAGPLAANVTDVALCLEAIAGDDDLDPRQRHVRTQPYSRALTGDVRGLRLALVEEGFDWPGFSEADVDDAVRTAASRFKELGAEVRTVSVPMHREGGVFLGPILREGGLALMFHGGGMGSNWEGFYSTSMQAALRRGFRARGDDLTDGIKQILLGAQWLHEAHGGHYYAKAQNLRRRLRAAYDAALADADLLVMPTTPAKAPLIADALANDGSNRAIAGITVNTAPFDVTGHPAVNVPCAVSDGLPVGMMLVGRHWEDGTVLRAAHAFEQTGAYTLRPSRAVSARSPGIS